jgi:cephalosporin hydroxylase
MIKSALYSAYKRLLRPVVNRMYYEDLLRHTEDFKRNTWLGRPILQDPTDLWVVQEVIAELRPDVLIETGTNRAGGALFYASLFDLLGKGRVVSVDIEKMHDVTHPRVTFLLGSSTAPDVVAAVRSAVGGPGQTVMVVLDSDHAAAHVARELDLYTPFVSAGSYCLVQDGVIDRMNFYAPYRPGPLPAIEAFLARNPDFVWDAARAEKVLVSHHPKGWLKRVREPARPER